VTIARAAANLTYPAHLQLIASMNPCPCGYLGDMARPCTSPQNTVQRYQARISGPILDRLDIHIEVPRLRQQELLSTRPGESSADIRARVARASFDPGLTTGASSRTLNVGLDSALKHLPRAAP
jgi:magnesium chelatase family protein